MTVLRQDKNVYTMYVRTFLVLHTILPCVGKGKGRENRSLKFRVCDIEC